MSDQSHKSCSSSWSIPSDLPIFNVDRAFFIAALTEKYYRLPNSIEFRFHDAYITVDVHEGTTVAEICGIPYICKVRIPFPAIIATLSIAQQKLFTLATDSMTFGSHDDTDSFHGIRLAGEVLERLPKHRHDRRVIQYWTSFEIRILTGGRETQSEHFWHGFLRVLKALARVEPARDVADIPFRLDSSFEGATNGDRDHMTLNFIIRGLIGYDIKIVMRTSTGVSEAKMWRQMRGFYHGLTQLRAHLTALNAPRGLSKDRLSKLPVEVIELIAELVMPERLVFGQRRGFQGAAENNTLRALALYKDESYSSSRVDVTVIRLNRRIRYAALPLLYNKVPVVIRSELMNTDWPRHCSTIHRSLGRDVFAHISALKVNIILRKDQVILQGERVVDVKLRQGSQAKLSHLRQLIHYRYGGNSNATQSTMDNPCMEVDYDDDLNRSTPRPYAPNVELKISVRGRLKLEVDISCVKPERIGRAQTIVSLVLGHEHIPLCYTMAARRMAHQIIRRFVDSPRRNMILQGDFNDP